MKFFRELLKATGIGLIIFTVLFFLALAQGKHITWDNNLFFNFLFIVKAFLWEALCFSVYLCEIALNKKTVR